VSDHTDARNANTPEDGADPWVEVRPKSTAGKSRTALWHCGALFHASYRYPRKRNAARIDRLAGILRNGLLAPAFNRDSSVCSDLNIVMTGSAVPYDSLVFLHRFGPQSAIYTMCDPGRFMVFIDPAFPVLTPESMGENWIVLCQDEVYVRDRVPVQSLIGVIVHPADAGPVITDCLADLRRLCIPLYDSDGNVLWKPRSQKEG
jgi:hypothetical protein